MIFDYFRKRRRREILAEPFPERWRGYLEQNVALWRKLDAGERAQLERDTRVILAEKRWSGVGGFEMTHEARVTIAGQAAVLLLGFRGDHGYFRNVREVLVYPSVISVPGRDGPIVTERAILGQAHYRGPIILAWDAVRHGGRDGRDGRNLVYHEFAHKLDLLDDLADGTPPIEGRQRLRAWVDVMTDAYEQLAARAAMGKPTLLDTYGATNPAEFFAVATECFFEKGEQLAERHTAVYEALRGFYRQDPAGRS